MILTAVPSGEMYAERLRVGELSSGINLADSLTLQEVVVTGTRNATDVRHLPMTVTVIGRDMLTAEHQTSVLPTVMVKCPGCLSPPAR